MANFPIKFTPQGVGKTKSAIKGLNSATKGLTTSLAKIGATIVIAKKLYDGIKGSIELAGKAQGLGQAFDSLGKGINASSQFLDKLKTATDGTVNSVELMTKANNAMTLGIVSSEDQMAELFDTAQRLGKALGVDTTQALDSLVTGMGRQSKLMLDNLGIIIDTNKAYEIHAEKLGKSTSALTDAEKKIAFNNAVLLESKRLVNGLGEEQLTMADRIAKAKSQVQDLGTTFGTLLMPVVNMALDLFNKFGEVVTKVMDYANKVDWAGTWNNFKEKGQLAFQALVDLIVVTFDYVVQVAKRILPKMFKFFVDKVLPAIMDLLQKLWDPLYIGLQIAGQYVMIGMKKLWNGIKNLFIDGFNYLKGIYNSFAEFVGLEPIDMTPRIDEANLDENREKIAQFKQDLEETDLGASLFGDNQDQIDNFQEYSDAFAEIVGNLGGQIMEVKEQVNPDNPEGSLLGGTLTPSEEELEAQKERDKQAEAEAKKKLKADQKIYKEGQKQFRENLSIASQEYKAFQELDKAMKIRDILIGIPSTVRDAYAAGMKSGGPGAPFVAAAFGAMAFASQMAQLKQLQKAQIGYEGLVTQPTMFLAGEGGQAEQVSVTPLNAPNIRGPQGGTGGDITINFSGNVMEEEYITEVAIPMIQDAVRRGTDL